MLLNSFAFEKAIDMSPKKQGDLWQAIENLDGFISWHVKKHNVMETKQLMFLHALFHYNKDEGSLNAYLRKLAQTIYLTTANPDIPVEFRDGNMVYKVGKQDETASKPDENDMITKAPPNHTEDFSDNVINSLYASQELKNDIYSLVLNNITEYVQLCKTLITGNMARVDFSEGFTRKCLELSSLYKEYFNIVCLNLYKAYQPIFDRFALEQIKDTNVDSLETLWVETDFNMIQQKSSKRVAFCNVYTHQPVTDADNEPFYVSGAKNLAEGKRILKVDFFNAWLYLCDKIDSSQTNEMKLILGNDCIIKTLGGSLSVVNPVLYNYYELLKSEFITNVLYETSGRLISAGTRSIYILWETKWPTLFQVNMEKMEQIKGKKWIEHKNIAGVEFDLIIEDVTEDLDCR